MSNPFGDYDDDEEESLHNVSSHNKPSSSSSSATYKLPEQQIYSPKQSSTQSTNPFGDFEDDAETKVHSNIPQEDRYSESPPKQNYRMNRSRIEIEEGGSNSSASRMSLNSSSSDVGALIGNYSLGDGSLQKEGLLCPDCMIEFKTITELIDHSQQKHRISNTSLAGKQASTLLSSTPFSNDLSGQMSVQINNFLNKFLKQNKNVDYSSVNDLKDPFADPNTVQTSTQRSSNVNLNLLSDPTDDWKLYMKIGPNRSYLDYFCKIRESRIERYVFETNKLLIRLDKLLRDYPPLNDLVRRREHEQSIVNWVDDDAVPLCPSCATKFNILIKKKHHCRLCGAVMCTKCSEFITFDFASQLITPINMDTGLSHSGSFTHSNKSQASTARSSFSSLSSSPSPMGFNFTKTSIMSFVTNPINSVDMNSENLDKMRVCIECKSLLMVRKEKLDVAHSKPEIVQHYEQLRENINEMDKLLPVYYKMADSLNFGESTYDLKDALEVKAKLTKIGEMADLLSRKIQSFGMTSKSNEDQDSQPVVSQRQLSVQLAIRRATVAYIRQYLLSLPELPNETELVELRKKHAEFIQKRIHYEKELALREQQQFKQIRDSSSRDVRGSSSTEAVISIDDGFCPQISSTDLWRNMNDQERQQIMDESDPMVQQMNIIRSYIRQARNDHRYDEVKMLTENLRELEIEHYFKQQQKQSSNSPTQPSILASDNSDGQRSLNPFDADNDDEEQNFGS